MSYAVIKTGGKQYIVTDGSKLKVEKLDVEEGKEVTFSEVLFLTDGEKVQIGEPFISGAKVEAKVLAQGKRDKLFGAKVKSKKRYKKIFGHRQPYTEVEITKIG